MTTTLENEQANELCSAFSFAVAIEQIRSNGCFLNLIAINFHYIKEFSVSTSIETPSIMSDVVVGVGCCCRHPSTLCPARLPSFAREGGLIDAAKWCCSLRRMANRNRNIRAPSGTSNSGKSAQRVARVHFALSTDQC